MRRTIAALLCVLALLSGSGCATYVNIPAQPGDIAANDPNDKTVRQAMAVALEAVAAEQPMDRFAIILPTGTHPATYDLIVPQISDAAMWSPDPIDPAIPVLEVRQLRLRGWKSQVDVIRPSSASPEHRELVTVYLKSYPVGGWAVQNLRVWRGSLEDALRESAQMEADVAP